MKSADIVPIHSGLKIAAEDPEAGSGSSIAYGGKLERGGEYFTLTLANGTQYQAGAPSTPSSTGGTVHIKVGEHLFGSVAGGNWRLIGLSSEGENIEAIKIILNESLGIPTVSEVVSGDFVQRFFAALKETPQGKN